MFPTIYICDVKNSGGHLFHPEKMPPRPPEKPPGGISISPLGLPLETTKRQGLRPLPFGNPPGAVLLRQKDPSALLRNSRGVRCARPPLRSAGAGPIARNRTTWGGFQGRGAAAPLPWSLRVGVQGGRESKLSPPGGSWGVRGAILDIKNGPPGGVPTAVVGIWGNSLPERIPPESLSRHYGEKKYLSW